MVYPILEFREEKQTFAKVKEVLWTFFLTNYNYKTAFWRE